MMPSQQRLLELVDRLHETRVAVLSDLVADEYLLCRTSRISREAPAALILSYQGRDMRPGGGANAVANLRALGAPVDPVGVVGEDAPGEELLDALQGLKIDTSGVLKHPSYRTVVKSRVLTTYHHSTRQQVLRIDREDTLPEQGDLARRLVEGAWERLAGARALLVSDYGYGAAAPAIAQPVIDRARAMGIPVTLDSRYRLLSYRRTSASTPNEPEVEQVLGVSIGDDQEALERAGRTLLGKLQSEAVLVTRGSRGMALFEPGSPTERIRVWGSDEIADVTGAGDTVIAVFTLGLAAGASYAEAAYLANIAGGIVVMKMGTATVSGEELRAALGGAPAP